MRRPGDPLPSTTAAMPRLSRLFATISRHRQPFASPLLQTRNFTLGTRPNMVAVYANGTLLADSSATKVVEGNHVSRRPPHRVALSNSS